MTATVTDLRVHRRAIPLVRPFVTAVRTATVLDGVYVEIVDSEGRSGWGEAPISWRVTGASPESVSAAVEGPLRAAVIGLATETDADLRHAFRETAAAVAGNASARMAVECALHDLVARARSWSLAELLGGDGEGIRTDMTISAARTVDEIDRVVADAVEAAGQGFDTVKIKTSGGEADDDAVRAVRQAVGNDVVLRVDANQGWSVARAIALAESWEADGVAVEVIEQPVHRDDVVGLAAVARAVSTPIMADETVWTRRDLEDLLRAGSVDLVNIKLAKTGGLSEAMLLARLAAEHGIGVLVGCMSESHIGAAAAAAFASAIAARGWSAGATQDLDAGLWLTRSPAEGGLSYEGPVVRLSDGPGTGIRGLVPAAPPGGR